MNHSMLNQSFDGFGESVRTMMISQEPAKDHRLELEITTGFGDAPSFAHSSPSELGLGFLRFRVSAT
jgi:hypothetical protein